MAESDKKFKDKHQCYHFNIILSKIKYRLNEVQYRVNGTRDSPEHCLFCEKNGKIIPFCSEDNLLGCYCCSLELLIQTKMYQDVWRVPPNHPNYMKITALTDLFGPFRNVYLIKRHILKSKRLFIKCCTYLMCRLVNKQFDDPKLSYHPQSVHAMRNLWILLTLCSAKMLRRLTRCETNKRLLMKICDLYLGGDFDTFPRMTVLLIHMIISDHWTKSKEPMFGFLTYAFMKKEGIRKLRLYDGPHQRQDANWSERAQDIHCGNRKCQKWYSDHKFGLKSWKYLELKRKNTKMKKLNEWYICKSCKCVHYCSRKCQKIDWKESHRIVCSRVRQTLNDAL